MSLFRFLLRASGTMLAAAMLMGAASGVSTALIINLINTLLHTPTIEVRMLVSFGLLGLINLVSGMLSNLLLVRLSNENLFHFSLLFCKRILQAPQRQVEETGIAKLMAVLTSDTQAISFAMSLLPSIFSNAVVVVACLGYLGSLSPRHLAFVLVVMGVGVVGILALLDRANRHFRAARNDQDALYEHYRAIIEGSKEMKLNRTRRAFFLHKMIHETGASYQQKAIRSNVLFGLGGTLGQLLFFVTVLGLILMGRRSHTDSALVSNFIVVLLFMMGPLATFVGSLPPVLRARTVLERLDKMNVVFSIEGDGEVVDEKSPPHDTVDSVQFVRVVHTYHQEAEATRFTLGPINLTLRPGQLTFLLGGNGSGKTTLAKLIAGLYVPENGSVLLNGTKITAANRDWYRQHFSAIFTDYYLFSQLDLLGLEDIEDDARRLLTALKLDHKVKVENARLSTTALSTGQRKRLALLMLYLEDRPIYIFDEWAADQDIAFKRIFYRELLPELKRRNKIVLVISHDERFFNVADEVLKLENGQLLEESTSHFLNRLGGVAPPPS